MSGASGRAPAVRTLGVPLGVTAVRITPETPEVRVPRLVGLMAVDARESAAARGVLLSAPDRPDFAMTTVVDYVVRQYPPPGTEVPRGAVVTVWFEFGEGEGAAAYGSRGARSRRPAGYGANWTSRESPCSSGEVRGCGRATDGTRPPDHHARKRVHSALKPRCSATTPPVRLRQATFDQPAPVSRAARADWSGQARMDSAR